MFLTRKGRAKQRARETLREIAKQGRVLPPTIGTVPCEYISLPALDIPKLAMDYIGAMEVQRTDDWCRCEWIIHPDDTHVPDHRCRGCKATRSDKRHDEESFQFEHSFQGRRKRRGEQANDCPVHTKEGFLIYFFEWVFTRGKH